MPDFDVFHKSLAAELAAVKDRVRNLISHSPTDGSYKEVVLRTVLKRQLPETNFVGTGFVVTPTASSTQIDVLIVDKDRPRLFWDGDFVIVTPEAVRAVIEVKTSLDGPSKIKETIRKLCQNKATWKNCLHGWDNFLGLFVYECQRDRGEAILQGLFEASVEFQTGLDCVAYGDDVFVDAPGKIGCRNFEGYVSRPTGGLAPACFINKLAMYLSKTTRHSNPDAWQPSTTQSGVLRYLREGGSIQEAALESCFSPRSLSL
jgi:hypothetical protein